MKLTTPAILTIVLLLASHQACALSQKQITETVTHAIDEMEKLSANLARCNAQIEKYRSSRAMQTPECLVVSESFEAHLHSHEKAMDILTGASLDIHVQEIRNEWWVTQGRLADRLKNTKILLEMDMHRHMEIIQKYRIPLN